MNKYNMYVIFIILIKVGFILLSLINVYLKIKGKEHTEIYNNILFWKERLEFIFTFLMSILLIYTFGPWCVQPIKIDKETQILFYLFGFVLIVTANWEIFIKQTPLLHTIQKTIK